MKKKEKLELASVNDIVRKNYKAYQSATKKGKGEILNELGPVTLLTRDHLAKKLAGWKEKALEIIDGKPVKLKAARGKKGRAAGKRGGRKPKYTDPGFVKVLTAIWDDNQRQCGKLLKPAIEGMIGFLESDGGYGITADIKELLLSVSAAEIDILLRPVKKAMEAKGISTTRSVSTPIRDLIPVLTHYDRDTVKPGYFNFDTVAHCGGSASGQFCKTLTGVDTYSGWIEERALLNAGNKWVQQAIPEIRDSLPFPMLGAHYDNGMEFINEPLLNWLLSNKIQPSRSRPYQKNDNPFAEQKNYDMVRKTVGYFRLESQAECDALAEVYKYLCPLCDYWYPTFKLIAKVKKPDGRYKKVYEKKPQTPYQRLLDSPDVSDECKAELRRRKQSQNPVLLARQLNAAVDRLLKLSREMDILRHQAPVSKPADKAAMAA
jgi:hypothetical protein